MVVRSGRVHGLKLILTAAAALLLIVGLNSRMGRTPPLGAFLSPFHGFWHNAEKAEASDQAISVRDGPRAPVKIFFDDRRVPHVFAQNDGDLYFAQGYVTARDRLWQMEFQTHAAAGRLAEIVGEQAISRDRFQRRIGMVYGARNTLREGQRTPEVWAHIVAYTRGINTYIQGLRFRDYPIEYKILDYAPEPWTPLKTALLLKYMAWDLSWNNTDQKLSNTRSRFGAEVVEELFPRHSGSPDPVMPAGTPWNFTPLEAEAPDTFFEPGSPASKNAPGPDGAGGSNNWAVSGERTASGYALLASDPHLGLNLPSVWYEIQLVSPTTNVYGVSLPGGPGVVIGFNQDIAWGLTNAGSDAIDWYRIRFKDASLQEYFHDGRWKATRRTIEEIEVRGGETVLDTVVYTHHGPLVEGSKEGPFYAVRWLAHDPSDEFQAIYRLNRAENYDDFVAALSHYVCPAQNFIFADRRNNIAIWHNGLFPLRWAGQGRYIADGSDPLHDWQNWVPHQQIPHAINPEQGFLSSANQHPTDPSYPYYLGWSYAPDYRARRINQQLEAMQEVEPEDLRALQVDTRNLLAESALPVLLARIDTTALSPEHQEAFQLLVQWDFHDDADKTAPTLARAWWRQLYQAIWADEFGQQGSNLLYPSDKVTAEMIAQRPEAKWYDDIRTKKKETLTELVQRSLVLSYYQLVEQLGPVGPAWEWGRYRSTEISHILRLPGFGHAGLSLGGSEWCDNARPPRHGPSWRLGAKLGPQVKGWGIYPGGQSGNPGSPHYDDAVEAWARGELAELVYLQSQDAAAGRMLQKLVLESK